MGERVTVESLLAKSRGRRPVPHPHGSGFTKSRKNAIGLPIGTPGRHIGDTAAAAAPEPVKRASVDKPSWHEEVERTEAFRREAIRKHQKHRDDLVDAAILKIANGLDPTVNIYEAPSALDQLLTESAPAAKASGEAPVVNVTMPDEIRVVPAPTRSIPVRDPETNLITHTETRVIDD